MLGDANPLIEHFRGDVFEGRTTVRFELCRKCNHDTRHEYTCLEVGDEKRPRVWGYRCMSCTKP